MDKLSFYPQITQILQIRYFIGYKTACGFLAFRTVVTFRVDISAIEGVSEGVSEGVNQGVESLFEMIRVNPGKRVPFFAQKLETSTKNIERWLKQLREEGKIEFRGAPKTGGYFLKNVEKL